MCAECQRVRLKEVNRVKHDMSIARALLVTGKLAPATWDHSLCLLYEKITTRLKATVQLVKVNRTHRIWTDRLWYERQRHLRYVNAHENGGRIGIHIASLNQNYFSLNNEIMRDIAEWLR